MDFADSVTDTAFRTEARRWLSENKPADSWRTKLRDLDAFVPVAKDWQAKKAAAGWACLHWPKNYGGREATMTERLIWSQEEGELYFMGLPFSVGIGMAAPTLMAYATEEQKTRYLPKIASGEEIWCQLFSEPRAGSDLAGIATKAERAEDGSGDWIVTGQKIWTSFAQYADYAILLARHDPTLPKHKGLTYFFVDMRSAGIEVRPIRQVSGGDDFNEVFLTEVRIPDSQRLGAVGEGWSVAMTTLMNERAIGTAMFPSLFDEMLTLSRDMSIGEGRALGDGAIRARLADWYVKSAGLKFGEYRMITAEGNGRPIGPEASITKLVAGKGRQEMASLMLDIQGPCALLEPHGQDQDGRFQHLFLRSVGNRIEAGTDEILRNIIAEGVLGLPSDIRADKGMAFNEIK